MERKNKSSVATAARPFPQLDFQNPFAAASQNGASTFLPLHRENRYAYPLVVWLDGSTDGKHSLTQVMPRISLRNYIGVAPDRSCFSATPGDNQPAIPNERIPTATTEETDEQVFASIDRACLQYNVNSSRIFVAGCGWGGTVAVRLALTYSNCFAGAISLCGGLQSGGLQSGGLQSGKLTTTTTDTNGSDPFPRSDRLFADLRANRKTPLFVSQCREHDSYPESSLCEDLKLLHVGGFSVTARQYPGCNMVNDRVLHDIDLWIMEIVNGYDMTKSDQTAHRLN